MRTVPLGSRGAATIVLTGAMLLGGAMATPATARPTASPGNSGAHRVLYPTVASAHSHAAAAHAANTAASLLAFGGGVDSIGVTTGTPKVVLVFWGSQWGTSTVDSSGYLHFSGDPKGMAPQVQAMLSGLGTGGELWSGTMTQYCEGVATGATSCPSGATHVGFPSGGNLDGVWQDKSLAPSSATGAQLAQEAISAAQHFGLTNNRNIQYVIVSPTGTHPNGFNAPLQWCAWHDWNGDWGVPSPVGDIAFTNLPYLTDAGGSCGQNFVNSGSGGTLDGVTIVEGHEYAETITDQNPAGGWTDSSGAENGDKCAWISSGQGAAANVVMGTGTFPMQSTWSNDGAACDISHAIVGTPTPDFTLAVSPTSQSVTQGGGTTYTITVTPANGFNSPVNMSVSGLPSGATSSFSPNPISSGSSTFAVTSGATSPGGTYPLTITGIGGGVTHTANASLTVNVPDFSLGVSPSSRSIAQNTNTTYTATVTPANGFNSSVALSVSGLPTGASGSLSPASISSGTSTLSVNSGTAAPGTYNLTITGTGGGITHTANASLTIASPTPVLHISAANAYAQSATNRYWNAWGDVTIVDQNGNPVSGVTVTFTFSGGASATRTCVTNTSGFCSTSSNKVRVSTSHHSETVTVTNVSKSGDTWDGVTATRTAPH